MRRGFTKIFLGYMIVLLDIFIEFMDFLPDPIGYYLIYSGMTTVVTFSDSNRKGEIGGGLAMALIFVSIPFVFSEYVTTAIDSSYIPFSIVTNVVQLIFMYYLFQILLDIAKAAEDQELYNHTSGLFYAYFTVSILISIIFPFTWNVPGGWLRNFLNVLSLSAFVVGILFLITVYRFRNIRYNVSKKPVGLLE